LTAAPTTLPQAEKAFLDKYQPLSNDASAFIGSKNGDNFTSSGLCFSEYPCFSVDFASTVGIGSTAPISQVQMAGLLDAITAMPVVQFDQASTDSPLNGFKVTSNGVVFEVISSPGMVSSSVMAGVAFDLYKIQGDDSKSNSIRGLLAATDNAPNPFKALCLYPEAADAGMAGDFCAARDPFGASEKVAKLAKRGLSVAGLLSGFCGLVDVPILCPEEE
jgi:hypothetical protein